jgi:hypothetical protein
MLAFSEKTFDRELSVQRKAMGEYTSDCVYLNFIFFSRSEAKKTRANVEDTKCPITRLIGS